MKILVACEFSGIVREAFRAKGHDAISCDYLDTEIPGPHIKGDVISCLTANWDRMIAFPPCTYLAISGARWFNDPIRQILQQQSLKFIRQLMEAPIPQIAIENPIGVISTKIRKPTQIIQPYQFGHPVSKATCLWLKNLPKLIPTNTVIPIASYAHQIPFNFKSRLDRMKARSRLLPSIAQAMADQWK